MLNKLVKLLSDFKTPVTLNGEWLCDYNIPTSQIRKELAQYLIANGVTIDVVHCGDCKYYDEIRGLCECSVSEEHLDEDDYCDYGVRLDSMQATSEKTSEVMDVHFGVYDKEETYENCTVQVLTNTVTGDVSVGWWQNE